MQFDPSISDVALIQNLKTLTAKERELGVEILWHLREMERRRLHLDSGFPSLFEYCTRELGYSAGAAARRIGAMRLLRELPSIETKIRRGEINLSQLAQAERFFKQESKQGRAVETEAKAEVIETLVGKSSRESEQILADLSPNQSPPDRERILSAELTEIRFAASVRLMEKIQRLKELHSHQAINPGYAELFELAMDAAIARKDLVRSTAPLRPAPESQPGSRHIPASIRREVFKRDQGRCQFQSQAGQLCGSKFQVQVDHRIPFGKGGTHELENLHLLCRAHNARKAELDYGRVRRS